MIDATPLPFDLPAVARKKLRVGFDRGNQSSDGGMLALRAADEKIGIIARLAATLRDRRDPSRIHHTHVEIIGARVLSICCGYEDGIDHNRLRNDPPLKMAVGRRPETSAALASQSTLPLRKRAVQDRCGACGSSTRRGVHATAHLVFWNLKTWLKGIHHGVSPKNLQAYLNQFTFHFNRRPQRGHIREGNSTLRVSGYWR